MDSTWNRSLEKETSGEISKHKLTNREKEILYYLACGKTNKEIAGELVLSVSTIKNHVSSVFIKLNLKNRSQATAYAIKTGLFEDYQKINIASLVTS